MRWVGHNAGATAAFAILLLLAAPDAGAQDAAPGDSASKTEAPPAPASPAQPPSQAPPATPASPVPPQNLETLVPGDALPILGTKVYDAAGQDMGPIVDVLVDRSGAPRGAVIDVGGFLGVGSRKVAVDWQLIYFRPWDEKMPILLDLTRAEVQAAPEYKGAKTVTLVGPPPPVEGKSAPDDTK